MTVSNALEVIEEMKDELGDCSPRDTQDYGGLGIYWARQDIP